MTIATEMKKLTQDIASSREDRTERVGEIREEVKQVRGEAQDMIEGFQASRKELKADLKEASVAWQELASTKAKNKGRRTKEWESQQE
ncbi:hypothetical protein ACFLWY_01795 [Chloroflexota bacterium]